MDIDYLDNLIQNNEIDQALEIIEEMGNNKEVSAISYLLEQLKITENHLLRNQIAIALSDMSCQEAVEPIINLLKDPKTLGYRGSLLYALEPLNYSEHLRLLFEFIMTGNFEVSRQSFILLEQAKESILQPLRQEYKRKIYKEIENLKDKIDFLTEAIEEFEL